MPELFDAAAAAPDVRQVLNTLAEQVLTGMKAQARNGTRSVARSYKDVPPYKLSVICHQDLSGRSMPHTVVLGMQEDGAVDAMVLDGDMQLVLATIQGVAIAERNAAVANLSARCAGEQAAVRNRAA